MSWNCGGERYAKHTEKVHKAEWKIVNWGANFPSVSASLCRVAVFLFNSQN